jgi:phosphoribosylformimino-5-aminoimidazole carboxamide ribotide isomerase
MAMAMTFEILPAIDLRGGHVVRLRQGDFDRETAYEAEPATVAEEFAAAGARWLHVVDLDGARSGVPAHGAVIASIVGAVGERARVEVAGGLRTELAVDEALASGAARVVVGTAALEDFAFAGRLVDSHGSEQVAVAIDVREGRALGHGWSADAGGIDAVDAIRRLADVGIATFEVTAIERDGLLEGPDLALYEGLVRLDRGVIIASGGVATLDDIHAVRAIGCSGAIIGRALYEGRLDLRDALNLTTERG